MLRYHKRSLKMLVYVVCGLMALAGLCLYSASVTDASGGEGCTLKVVSSLPLRGSYATETASMMNAYQLALQEHGAETQDGKCRLVLVSLDDSSAESGMWNSEAESANAKQAAADPETLAYLAPFNSGAAKISIPLLNQSGPLVMVGAYNTYWGLTKADYAQDGEPSKYYPTGIRNYARVIPSDELQGAVAARWYQAQGIKSVDVIQDGSLYGKGVAAEFVKQAKTLGLEIKSDQTVNFETADVVALANQVAKRKSDAVYLGGIGSSQVARFLSELRALNWQGLFGGADALLGEMMLEPGDASEGMIVTHTDLPAEELAKTDARTAKWLVAYKTQFGSAPEPPAIYAYEAMRVVLAALDKCSAADDFSRVCVRDAVMTTHAWDGILGQVWSFDANGDTTLQLVSVYQVVNGKWQIIGLAK